MQKFFDLVVSKLPGGVQPYAKALVPVTVAGVLVLQDLTVSVEEVAEIKTLALGAVTSVLVYAFRNIGK